MIAPQLAPARSGDPQLLSQLSNLGDRNMGWMDGYHDLAVSTGQVMKQAQAEPLAKGPTCIQPLAPPSLCSDVARVTDNRGNPLLAGAGFVSGGDHSVTLRHRNDRARQWR